MNIKQFITNQLASWPMAAKNHRILSENVITRSLNIGTRTIFLQHNPLRATSTGANTDAVAIAARPCFLCPQTRPPEQSGIQFRGYDILINPFPIFQDHLTIADNRHSPQRISPRFADMLALANTLPEFTVFYNGPACGASAPDHAHFQAAPSVFFPLWKAIGKSVPVFTDNNSPVCIYDIQPAFYLISSSSATECCNIFNNLLNRLPVDNLTGEPPINLLICYNKELYQIALIPRSKHRPANFGTAKGQFLISPASIDMSGVIIAPRQSDFDSLTAAKVKEIIDEVSYPASRLIIYLNK